MSLEGELEAAFDLIGEFQIDRGAIRGQIDQRRVREPDLDRASECGDGGIGAVDQAVGADGLDLLEVVGIGERAGGEVGDP